MEIQQLKGFYYSAKLGNLTKAAEKMAITQSAVSQQIKSLEEELGVKLFNRFGPRKELTPDGTLFYNLIAPLMQELDSLKITFEDMKGNQRGPLTMAATTFMIMNFLPPYIKHFTEKYPHVRVIILERRWNEIVALAQAGEIDMGFAPSTATAANLEMLPLAPMKRVLVTSLGHPLTRKADVTPEDIARYPFITYEKGLVAREEIARVFSDRSLSVEVIMEVTNVETIKKYVEMGVGIAIVPEISLPPEAMARLAAIPVDHYFQHSGYSVILRKGKHITSWAQNFLLMIDPLLTFG